MAPKPSVQMSLAPPARNVICCPQTGDRLRSRSVREYSTGAPTDRVTASYRTRKTMLRAALALPASTPGPPNNIRSTPKSAQLWRYLKMVTAMLFSATHAEKGGTGRESKKTPPPEQTPGKVATRTERDPLLASHN